MAFQILIYVRFVIQVLKQLHIYFITDSLWSVFGIMSFLGFFILNVILMCQTLFILDLNCLKIQILLNCLNDFLLNDRFLIYRHKYKTSKLTVASFIRTINCVKINENALLGKTVN